MLGYADFRRDWAARHGGLEVSHWVDPWLRVSYGCAIPFVQLGIPADVVTLLAPLAAVGSVGAAWAGWWVLAAILVGVSGLLDGIDGAVAALSGRAGPWGAVLDSVVDRLADAAFLVALWFAGAPAAWCTGGWVALGLLEYSRARAASLGTEGLPVTVGERPTRLAVIGMFLLAAGVFDSTAWAYAGTVLVAALSTFGWLTLMHAARARLSQ